MIPFIDLNSQQNRIRPQIDAAIARVLDHGKYIMGPEVLELEEKLAEFVGAKHCLACSSGTDALMLGLMARGIGPGDVVFTTPFTFFATAEVIALLGATPVFVDIDRDTYNIDPAQLELAIQAVEENDASIYPLPSPFTLVARATAASPFTSRCVIPVDLFGLPADYDSILPIAQEHGLFVLQDAAQAFGAEYKGKKCPTQGDIGATSFFPAKPLGCYGDGGAVFTDDDQHAEVMRSIRVHGQGTDKYNNIRIGLNARIDTLQAAILLEKLKIYSEEIQLRQQVAQRYYGRLTHNTSNLKPQKVPEGSLSVNAQFCLESDRRDEIQTKLKQAGIPTAIYYVKPLHLLDAYSDLGYKEGDFPIAEQVSERIFALPMHPYLTDDDQKRIVNCLLKT
jgi:UDP-2-acetamido-2-deoxy-ribo-hexuluronate aminotransferase